jgi:hypothetical protein
MSIPTSVKLLFLGVLVVLGYRYQTGTYPVALEVTNQQEDE